MDILELSSTLTITGNADGKVELTSNFSKQPSFAEESLREIDNSGQEDTPGDTLVEDYSAPAIPYINRGKDSYLVEKKVINCADREASNSPGSHRDGYLQFMAFCFCFFLGGWNDAATGPLLPTLQRAYKTDFTVVSLIFIASSLGFVLGGLLNMRLADKKGMGATVFFGSLFQIIGCSIQISAPPFPLLLVAFMINGFGWALQMAQGSGYISHLPNPPLKLGISHASYGIGALVVPLVSTHFSHLRRWSFHYLTSLSLAVINSIILATVLRFRREEELFSRAGIETLPSPHLLHIGPSKFKRMMRLPEVHYFGAWGIIYIGVEVTTGGWVSTFLTRERHAGNSAGYVATGFWAGLTVGRVAFIWINNKIGERRVVFIYSALAITLQLTTWFIPSLLENAIAFSFTGLFLGPMFPIAMRQASKVFPPSIMSGVVGWIAAVGQAGSVTGPFIAGALASRFGIGSLQPLLVSMMVCMVVIWALVPYRPRS